MNIDLSNEDILNAIDLTQKSQDNIIYRLNGYFYISNRDKLLSTQKQISALKKLSTLSLREDYIAGGKRYQYLSVIKIGENDLNIILDKNNMFIDFIKTNSPENVYKLKGYTLEQFLQLEKGIIYNASKLRNERLAKIRLEEERLAKIERARLEKLERERLEKERMERERLERERLELLRRQEQERLKVIKAENEKFERLKALKKSTALEYTKEELKNLEKFEENKELARLKSTSSSYNLQPFTEKALKNQLKNFLGNYIDIAPKSDIVFNYDIERKKIDDILVRYILEKYQNTCFSSKLKLYKLGKQVEIDFESEKIPLSLYTIQSSLDESQIKNILQLFKVCIDGQNSLICIPVSISGILSGETHANVLLYRTQSNTFEYYEPHGSSYFGESLIQANKEVYDRIFRNITYIINQLETNKIIPPNPTLKTPEILCPSRGFQDLEGKQTSKCYTNVRSSGFCAIWAAFYIELCLNFPEYDGDILIQNVLKILQEINCGFSKFVMSYVLTQIKNIENSYDINILKDTKPLSPRNINKNIRYKKKGNCIDYKSGQVNDIIEYIITSPNNIVVNIVNDVFTGASTWTRNDLISCYKRNLIIGDILNKDFGGFKIIDGKKFYPVKTPNNSTIIILEKDFEKLQNTENVFFKFEQSGKILAMDNFFKVTAYKIQDYLEVDTDWMERYEFFSSYNT